MDYLPAPEMAWDVVAFRSVFIILPTFDTTPEV